MCEDLRLWITLLRDWLSDPMEGIEEWHRDARVLAADLIDSSEVIEQILECLYEQQMAKRQKLAALSPPKEVSPPIELPPPPTQDVLDALISREQTAQRTEAWYAQAQTVVTASEVSNLFGSPRARGQLVATKAQPYQSRNQFLAVTSDGMSPFDWGIRFEPCIKAIYEDRHGAVIKDLGRLVHPTDPRTSASPDGLVYSAADPSRRGRLVEFKAPVTREIQHGVIPKDYQMQMQLQLHVTGLHVCDYVEASFAAPYGSRGPVEGPGWCSGVIAVVQREAPQDGQMMYYVYSPLHVGVDWVPSLEKESDQVVERVPWRLMQWQEQIVLRSEEWWQALLPQLDSFWADVEQFKSGAFTVPESTRPPKKRPVEICMINFTKLDENGILIPPPHPVEEVCAIVL